MDLVSDVTSRVAAGMTDKLNALLAALPPDHRLCVHRGTFERVDATFQDVDAYVFRFKQKFHILSGPDLRCETPDEIDAQYLREDR